MKILFTDDEVERTQEYFFWKRMVHCLVYDSPSCRSDLIKKYLWDDYRLKIEQFNYPGPLLLRSVECPESLESFLRLKYK
jgi:hypothetical protein